MRKGVCSSFEGDQEWHTAVFVEILASDGNNACIGKSGVDQGAECRLGHGGSHEDL